MKCTSANMGQKQHWLEVHCLGNVFFYVKLVPLCDYEVKTSENQERCVCVCVCVCVYVYVCKSNGFEAATQFCNLAVHL